jgi:hypothetical protein
VCGDDGCPTKTVRVERNQAEGEPSAQGVSDDRVDPVGQGVEDVVDAVLEGPDGGRAGAMSRQVDREGRLSTVWATNTPILAAARESMQQEDQSVASAMRASRSLSRSIRA